MNTEPKARGILMHARSVDGILMRRKTQTRRIVKPQPAGIPVFHDGRWWEAQNAFVHQDRALKCPLGKPGDLLWVREAWGTLKEFDHLPPRDIPPGSPVRYAHDLSTDSDRHVAGKNRPGLFMPRWASRITLRITDVRVERVQDISEEDAIAEGIVMDGMGHAVSNDDDVNWMSARAKFADLWDDTNGKGAWDRNDWVWVIVFEVLKP